MNWKEVKSNILSVWATFLRYDLYIIIILLVWRFLPFFKKEIYENFITGGLVWIIVWIPISLVISIVLVIIYTRVEEKWCPIIKSENGVYRKKPVRYYFLREFVMKIEVIVTLGTFFMMCFLGYYKKSFVESNINVIIINIIIIIICCWSLIKFARKLSGLQKNMEVWINEEGRKNKKICTYIGSEDFSLRRVKGSIRSIISGKEEIKSCSEVNDLIWENENIIICPYCFLKEYVDVENDRIERFIFLNNGVSEDKIAVIDSVIDEYICAQKNIAEYTFVTEEIRKSEERPIKRFSEKKRGDAERVFQYISGKDVQIPYFEEKIFTYHYPKSVDVLVKYEYLDGKIEQLNEIREPAECFYQLLKVVEYVWHYRALVELSKEDEKRQKLAKKPFQSSLGIWEKYQNNVDRSYDDEETVQAYRLIKNVLENKKCGSTKVKYSQLCQILTQLRNRYVGHGTMAFSVSHELLDAVKQLVKIVLDIFYAEEDITIEKDKMLIPGIPLVCDRTSSTKRSLGLLAGYMGENVAEYLDYENAVFCSKAAITYRLDYQEKGK